MKRRISIIFLSIGIFLALFTGCSSNNDISCEGIWREDNGKVKVLSTISMIDDLVKKIGGEYVDSIALIRGELDPHSYELVKGDGEKFLRADIIFYNGLGLEHGHSLRQNLEGNPKARALGERVDPGALLTREGHYDPHIWMDIGLFMQIVDPIVEVLSQQDPPHAEVYRANGLALHKEMERADRYVWNLLQSIPKERRYLVTSHDAFHYFAKHYLAASADENVQRCFAPEGLAPEAQISLAYLQAVMDHVRNLGISVLFPESNVNQDALRKLVEIGQSEGEKIHLCESKLYGDAMGDKQSYLEMIIHNAEVIAKELLR